MPGIDDKRARHLRLIVNLVPFLANNPGIAVERVARPGGAVAASAGKMALLERALDESRRIRVTCYDRARDAFWEGAIEPLALHDIHGVWHLWAARADDGRRLTLRIDRIRDISLLEESFDPAATNADEAPEETASRPAVRIRFGPESARWPRQHYRGEIVSTGDDGSVLCEFASADPAWVLDLLAEFAGDARLETPAETARAAAAGLDAVLALYRQGRGRALRQKKVKYFWPT